MALKEIPVYYKWSFRILKNLEFFGPKNHLNILDNL